ncbi:MAG TPA: hypothetical protein VEG68_07830 [Terriglobales bacterium]|nr:hypothetical protein [Terriglobales bacterium]
MDKDPSPVNELLERRVTLMHELAASLELAQVAILHSDARRLSVQTQRQQELCEELRRLVPELVPGHAFPVAKTARSVARTHLGETEALSPARQRQRALLTEWLEIETRVADLNRAYGSLLRRARRTVDIFCRVLANSGVTYLPPAPQSPAAVEDSRG